MVEDNFLNILKNKNISITEETILERLLDRYRWPQYYPWGQPSVEAILEDGTKHQNFFNKDGYLDSEKCIKTYEEGYTLILSNIAGFCKDTWIFESLLKDYFKKNINCNFYFGNGKKSVSFPKHKHDYVVIVKSIYGDSDWIIDKNKINVRDQECIWFDKYIDHEVVAINNLKLSMTCNPTS